MSRLLAALSLALAASTAHALPVVFASEEYETTAFAEVGPGSDSQADTSPPSTLLLLSEASVGNSGDANTADAQGIADTLFLAASAWASSEELGAFGVGTSSFLGTFNLGPGRIQILLDFETVSADDGDAASEGQVFVALSANGAIVLDEVVGAVGEYERSFDLTSDTLGVLEILLTSTADAVSGSAINVTTLGFQVNQMPEPATLLLTLPALLAFVARRSPFC